MEAQRPPLPPLYLKRPFLLSKSLENCLNQEYDFWAGLLDWSWSRNITVMTTTRGIGTRFRETAMVVNRF